ncbi:peptidase [Parvularcula maris]|uniref:Peptidase n=1 Tax=Parvularcula maris TaxID=2965077 RepID=A0A9X2L9H8_9PROT|nr:peptidase [Parvularcula maris]MCQ8184627.1 peptidase [Parvularcula maris]
MTYCIALKLDAGLVCLSDTRTNAGVDNISRYKKTFTWQGEDRAIVLMSAGNLSITQSVIDHLNRAVALGAGGTDGQTETIMNVPSLARLAELVGQEMRQLIDIHGAAIENAGASSGASIIIGGQIGGEPMRLFLVYSAGNFIECGEDTPYFQIGETKYGKPIIDRTLSHGTSLAVGLRTALVSMDLTVRSNLSVGLPLDLTVIENDALRIRTERRIDEHDETYASISMGWDEALKTGLQGLPSLEHWLDEA